MSSAQNLISNVLPGGAARLAALAALAHALDKGKPLDMAWAQDRHFAGLAPSDRAFAQLLAKTALRRLGQIDALLAGCLERPLPANLTRILHILRLGVAQLIWLKTPPHAAVHASVEMAKQIKMTRQSGLVNAVLKRIAQDGQRLADAQDAARLNTPPWLWASWENAYGPETTRRIAAAHLEEPPLDITPKADPALWAERLGGTLLPTGSIRLREARAITRLEGFAEGAWWVQDTAASLPARLLGDVKGKRVLDFCAAPGGKTAQLVAAVGQVTAVELSKERMALLKTNLHRLGLHADTVVADALTWRPGFMPDAILLDAPCSATGTLRRHPDVARHRQPADIGRLAETQWNLLRHALELLPSGGLLAYAVCSLQPEEGEWQIDRLLNERKDVMVIPAMAGALGLPKECVTLRGEVRTLPYHVENGGMDGFYAVKLKKIC